MSGREQKRVLSVAIFVAVMSQSVGCVKHENAAFVQSRETPLTAMKPAQPSLRADTLSRSHWPAVATSPAPVAVIHAPLLVPRAELSDNPRARGEYPTPATVAHRDPANPQAALHATLEYPRIGWQWMLIPLRLVQGEWPWAEAASPQLDYQRLPAASGPADIDLHPATPD